MGKLTAFPLLLSICEVREWDYGIVRRKNGQLDLRVQVGKRAIVRSFDPLDPDVAARAVSEAANALDPAA